MGRQVNNRGDSARSKQLVFDFWRQQMRVFFSDAANYCTVSALHDAGRDSGVELE